jgi:chromosomal replication initiation ATPase DnaA
MHQQHAVPRGFPPTAALACCNTPVGHQLPVNRRSAAGRQTSNHPHAHPRTDPRPHSYQLSDDKSFASLFHPDKAALLELLDAFAHGRGKFAIPGYPQKLGFLLHGPPGTGKTSLIKALAAHTGRSIVSVPLSRVCTNQELMDMMFDQAVAVEGRVSDRVSALTKKALLPVSGERIWAAEWAWAVEVHVF